MKRSGSRRLGTVIAAGLTLLCATTSAGRPAQAADAVTDWNAIMQATMAPANPHFQSRASALVHLAVFEAVNAITGDYEPYLGTIVAPAWASPEAAAVAAAHGALVALPQANVSTLNAQRAASLAAIPDGPAKAAGIAVGEAAAAAMLLLRANDGSATAGSVPYTPGTRPGDWQPAPPAFAPASLVGWGKVTPFGLKEGSQFRPPPPPALHSGTYAISYEEVKRVGSAGAGLDARPQSRTDVARFYAVTSPVQVWCPAARQASEAQGKTLSENARIFALLGMALADASISSYEAKYHYNFWRPQMAIRGGDLDDNRHTEADPAWVPLLTTPSFPSYPSAHATLSNAAREVLERCFGNQGHDITLTNATLGLTLHYSTFRQMTDDIDDARVYGGIHFRFEQVAGEHQGRKVANYVLTHYLRGPADASFAHPADD